MRKKTGFTLIELMVTLAVLAILLTLAVPSFQTIIQNNRMVTQANELVTALNLARSEAIKRGVRVTVCRSTNNATCNNAAGVWDRGWVVFVDPAIPGTVGAPAAEPILRVHQLPANAALTLRTGANYANFVSYLPSGLSLGDGGDNDGAFSLCDARGGPSARTVVVNVTGRASNRPGAAACP